MNDRQLSEQAIREHLRTNQLLREIKTAAWVLVVLQVAVAMAMGYVGLG